MSRQYNFGDLKEQINLQEQVGSVWNDVATVWCSVQTHKDWLVDKSHIGFVIRGRMDVCHGGWRVLWMGMAYPLACVHQVDKGYQVLECRLEQ